MQFLSTLLTAISLLLPGSGSEVTPTVGLDTLSVTWAEQSCDLCLLIHSPADLPSPTRLLIEGLDETALGEEESNEIDSSTVISEIVFGENSFSTFLLSPSSPHALHARPPLTFSILRC
jgi:hypothetical protein